MAAPFRVPSRRASVGKVSRQPTDQFKDYLEQLMRVIPGEIIGLYLLGTGLVPRKETAGLIAWFVFCFLALLVVRRVGNTDKPNQTPQWRVIAVSAVAFVVWVYSTGGVFEAIGVHVPWIGSLMVLAVSFLIPYVYSVEAER